MPCEEEKPSWYDGEWYVELSLPNEAENERLMQNFDCYMIYLDQVLIGIFWLHIEEPDSLTLEDFCILPAYQGRGFGQQAIKR